MLDNEPHAKVLVVDDQPDVADALGSLVRSLGHQASVAYEPETALEIARALQPDIAIVDLTLRDANGRELAATLRRESLGPLRLVALSGYEVEPHHREFEPSFDYFLTKPPELDALLRVFTDFRDR